jgi:hypothetical protein
MLVIAVVLIAALVAGVSTAFAAKGTPGKSPAVIQLSNGFPSGEHYNLNIHGKKAGFTCDPSMNGGGSVFVPEYGNATIEYVTNKKASLGNLTALDACAFDDGKVRVQLPYNEAGYDVYARILGKPQNGKNQPESNIMLYPTSLVEACGNVTGNETSCDQVLAPIGIIAYNATWVPSTDPQEFVRFANQKGDKRGKSTAMDITALFEFTGFAAADSLDLNTNGAFDDCDVPGQCSTPGNATQMVIDAGYLVADYDGDADWGNSNGVIDTIGEWLLFNADLYAADPINEPYCVLFSAEWILNIAELVTAGQIIENDGTKLLQIRFYPR